MEVFINPVEIMELEKIGAQAIPQLTEANISRTDRTRVARISKTDKAGVAKISKTDRIHMMTTGITTGMAPTIPVADGAGGVDIIADWH